MCRGCSRSSSTQRRLAEVRVAGLAALCRRRGCRALSRWPRRRAARRPARRAARARDRAAGLAGRAVRAHPRAVRRGRSGGALGPDRADDRADPRACSRRAVSSCAASCVPAAPGSIAAIADVLRQLRRRTLAKLRAQVAPVDAESYAAFLPRWHGLDQPRRGTLALRDAIGRLEGVALPFSELEQRILPARIADYHPRHARRARRGRRARVGRRRRARRPDGRVVLLRRERAHELAPAAQPIANHGPLHDAIARAPADRRCRRSSSASSRRRARRAPSWSPRCGISVWAGLVTNDTFAPLRSLAAPSARRANAHATFGGRWSLSPAGAGVAAQRAGLDVAGPTGTARPTRSRSGCSSAGASRAGKRRAPMTCPAGSPRSPTCSARWRTRAPCAAATSSRVSRARSTRGPARSIGCARRPAARPIVSTCSRPSIRRTRGAARCPGRSSRDPDARPARRVGATVVLVDGRLARVGRAQGQAASRPRGLPAETIELALAIGLPRLAVADSAGASCWIETIDGVGGRCVAVGTWPARGRRPHRLPRPRRARARAGRARPHRVGSPRARADEPEPTEPA